MEFDLRKYWKLVSTWWWLLVIGAAVPALISYRFVSQQPDVYQARVILMVGTTMQSTNPSASEMGISQRLAIGYAEMVRYRPVTQEVINRLGLSTTPEKLADQISTGVRPNANLLEIYVTDKNPQAAAVIANTVAEVLIGKTPAAQAQGEQQRFIKGQLDALRVKIEELEDAIGSQEAELAGLTSAAEIRAAQENLDSLEEVLSRYRSEYAGLLQSYAGDSVNQLTVVEPAIVPTSPRGGRKVLVVGISGAAGIGLSLAGVFLMTYLDDTLKWNEVRDQSLLGFNVLGGVGRMATGKGVLMNWPAARSPEAESLRALRANILFQRLQKPFQTVLISSAGPQEGKSFVAAALAVGLADAGLRVVLVDCDLRKPTVHLIFDLVNVSGTAELLRSDETLRDVSVKARLREIELSNLQLLPAGQPPLDPLPLLMSPRFANLMVHLREMAEVVILDVPPLLAVSDATVVASHCDISLFVIANNLTTHRQLRLVGRHLEQHPEFKLLGTVFNQVKLRDPESYYYRKSESTTARRIEGVLMRLGPLAKVFGPPDSDVERYVGLTDAAETLGIPVKMARRWTRTGRLSSRRSGLRVWILRDDLRAYLEREAGGIDGAGSSDLTHSLESVGEDA
jgi:capsular exopolysaccharide synthesis family protein